MAEADDRLRPGLGRRLPGTGFFEAPPDVIAAFARDVVGERVADPAIPVGVELADLFGTQAHRCLLSSITDWKTDDPPRVRLHEADRFRQPVARGEPAADNSVSFGQEDVMHAYAVAVIAETRFGDDVRRYLESIDDTLRPHGGEYVIHGGPYDVLEGDWSSDLVVIRFPSMDAARAWYASDAYRAIRELRTANTTGVVFLVDGVEEGHRAIDLLRR